MGTGSLIRRYKILFRCSNPKSSIIDSGLMDSENCTGLGNQPISDSEDLQGKEQCDDSHCEATDDLHVVNEIENNEEAIEEVILGKEFIDVESAYKFYKNYGGKHGFNVRIRNSRKNNENFVTCRNLRAFWSVQKHTKIVNVMFNYLVF